MNYFDISYTAIGGLGIFFLGLKFLSEGLQSGSTEAIQRILATLTKNRVLAVLAGVGITVFVQSSSISTVMTVSLVNAGLMELKQAIGVILGANIGTTVTGWILSIKVGKYGLLLIGLGIYPMMAGNSARTSAIGKTLVALGLIFTGLEFMSGAFEPLREDPNFISYLHLFDAQSLGSLLACVAIGCLLTVIIQSSSAMLGITITLASTGVIDFNTAVALIIGENIGTTITAQLAAIGANTSAVRTARAHAIFNMLGAVIFVAIFPYYVGFIEWIVANPADAVNAEGGKPNIAWHIAVAHTMFNVLNVLIWIPLIDYLVKFVIWLVPHKGEKEVHKLKYLGNRATMAPEVALQQADLEMDNLIEITREMFNITRDYTLAEQHDKASFDRINHLEDITDNIEEEMINFITTVLTDSVTQGQSARAYGLIRMADEFESIADSLQSFSIYRARLFKQKESISAEAWADLTEFYNEVDTFVGRVAGARKKRADSTRITGLLEEGKRLNKLANAMRDRHLERLKTGTCMSIPAQTYSDMFVSLRHIKNHAVNILETYAN
ncbi:MAG: Na/Pi cotransporter family protein [Gammaproteobacteria bacterium]|nr:Na/Pi cotransporter family protein [Gammaproteobacteria bacterium]MDP2348336.1 Na/Pi cotransporter family protein [Gammaproteobacteria bacterium]